MLTNHNNLLLFIHAVGVLIMFGGSNQIEFSNEVFVLDWYKKEWKMLQEGSEGEGDKAEGQDAPIRRNFHSAILYRNPDRFV